MLHSVEIGKKITKYRKNLKVSQIFLSKLLGVSSQAVSKWECGSSTPNLHNLVMLAEIFGIKVESFLDYRCELDISPLNTNELLTEKKYSIIIKSRQIKILPTSFKKDKIENVFYLEVKQNDAEISNVLIKGCVYSKCVFDHARCNNVRYTDVIDVESKYEGVAYDNCVFDHCQAKMNVTSGVFNRVTFSYNIYLSEKLHNAVISNSKLIYSSYTNFVLNRVTVLDSL